MDNFINSVQEMMHVALRNPKEAWLPVGLLIAFVSVILWARRRAKNDESGLGLMTCVLFAPMTTGTRLASSIVRRAVTVVAKIGAVAHRVALGRKMPVSSKAVKLAFDHSATQVGLVLALLPLPILLGYGVTDNHAWISSFIVSAAVGGLISVFQYHRSVELKERAEEQRESDRCAQQNRERAARLEASRLKKEEKKKKEQKEQESQERLRLTQLSRKPERFTLAKDTSEEYDEPKSENDEGLFLPAMEEWRESMGYGSYRTRTRLNYGSPKAGQWHVSNGQMYKAAKDYPSGCSYLLYELVKLLPNEESTVEDSGTAANHVKPKVELVDVNIAGTDFNQAEIVRTGKFRHPKVGEAAIVHEPGHPCHGDFRLAREDMRLNRDFQWEIVHIVSLSV